MQKTLRLLAILLGVQLLLALGLSQSGPGLATTDNDKGPLIPVASERINRITLEGPDDALVTLVSQGDGWQLPALENFPADAQRVRQLIEQLTTLKPGLPVASSRGARERFKVSEEQFERRITLADGDQTLATLYLGSSPGRNRIHARLDDQDEIRTLKLAAYEVPVRSRDWEDKTILQLPEEQISAIQLDDLKLERQASDWTADGLKEGESLNTEAAEKLARQLAKLRINEVLGQAQKPEYGLEEPALDLTLVRQDGKQVSYRLGKQADQETYTLKVSSRPEYFSIPGFTAKPLIEAASQRDKLIKPATTADSSDQDDTTPTQGAS